MSQSPPDQTTDVLLESVLESISDAFYVISPKWTFALFNGAAERYFGIERAQVLGRDFWEVFPQGAGTPFEKVLRRAMDRRKPATFESPSRWWPERTVEVRVTPLVDGGVGVSLQDVTERKKAEEARDLLMREVDHRSRNLLSVVQAVVRLTRADDIEAYKAAVLGRVEALSRAQGALARRRWEDAPLDRLAEESLAAVLPPGVYSLQGPPVALRPDQAQPVSMILHELATNACKYGALSGPDGRVALAWTLAPQRLSLTWAETGGPAVTAPVATGFGARLIEQLTRQLDGEVLLDWRAEGLLVGLTVPVA